MVFNWRPSKINTQLKGLPQNEDPFDYISKAIQREDMAGYRPSQNVGPINYQHGGNAPINYDGYSPTTSMTEEEIANNAINNNVNSRQFGNAGDMANWIQQGGTPQADAAAAQAQAEQQAAMAKQKQIADIQSQISVLEKRLTENKAKLSNWTGNADKIAAIEARKINVNDPTSIWRWKEDRDNARRIANEQNKTNNSAKANALIEVTNAVDNMVVDPSMDTPTANAMLSKLADYKTMLQKNGLPTKMVDDKIAEIKGDNKKVITETSETEDDVTYEGKDREQSESKASRLLDKKTVTVQELENASKSNVSNDTKNKLLAKRDEVKAKNIQEEKDQKRENSLLGKGKFLTSEEIQFMEGRKDVKKHTDDFGNIWFTKRQL